MRVKSIALLDGNKYEFSNFNVFVGGNAVGKTTLLLELFRHAIRGQHGHYWVKDCVYESTDFSKDVELLKGSLHKNYEGANYFYYSSASRDINGNPDRSADMRYSGGEVEVLNTKPDATILASWKWRVPFVAFANADSRLGVGDSGGKGTYRESPGDPINVLHRHRDQLQNLHDKVLERFGFHFVMLDHTGTGLDIGLAGEQPPAFDHAALNKQAEFEKIEAWKQEKFTPLSQAGHGIRSMVRLLTMFFDPVARVLMVDEPEMHLYPKHRRWLGQQLVQLAKESRVQVFLVTHDPVILQGILDVAVTTRVFRIDRDTNGAGRINTSDLQSQDGINTVSNQEQYLQSMFYQRCVAVEGPTDRLFYQSFEDAFPGIEDKDLGFIACAGKGSVKSFAFLAAKVRIPCAIIFDLDAILFSASVIRDVFTTLGGLGDPLAELFDAMAKADAAIGGRDEGASNKAIRKLTGYTDKAGTSSEWADAHSHLFEKVRVTLAKKLIFLVPHGNLESWAPDVEPKARFAELAPPAIRGDRRLLDPLLEFLSRVLASVDALPSPK